MFLILFRNILCPQQMFSSLRAQGNVMSNNVSSFARALSPGSITSCFESGLFNFFRYEIYLLSNLLKCVGLETKLVLYKAFGLKINF